MIRICQYCVRRTDSDECSLTRETDFEEASDGFWDVTTEGLDSVCLLVLADFTFAAC